MSFTEGKIRTSTGLRNSRHPITAIRPIYDAAGSLTACQVEVEAQMDDGSTLEVRIALLPLLTAAQRTTLTGILAAVANRVTTELM